MKRRGFTLIEFVAMISLLMIIAAITIPSYSEIIDKQRLKADAATAAEMAKIAETCYAENKSRALNDAKLKDYVKKIYGGEFPVSQYDAQGSFEVELSEKGRATVRLRSSIVTGGAVVFVREGRFQEPDWESLTAGETDGDG